RRLSFQSVRSRRLLFGFGAAPDGAGDRVAEDRFGGCAEALGRTVAALLGGGSLDAGVVDAERACATVVPLDGAALAVVVGPASAGVLDVTLDRSVTASNPPSTMIAAAAT